MANRIHNLMGLFVIFGLLFSNESLTKQDGRNINVNLADLSISGNWYWYIGPYLGHFDVVQNGTLFSGSLDDEWEGTYGDKIINGIITGNSISFTRDGKYGIQYWKGDVTDNNGILEINNGLWRKEGITTWSSFHANRTSSISGPIFIDDNTKGYYSTAVGSLLQGTQLQFPPANTIGSGEPNLYPALEPDISSTELFLGNWLAPKPLPLNPNWSGLQDIPKTWTTNTSLSIIYPVDAGPSGIQNITGSFGVDNGMYLWINGNYKFGATQPGSLSGMEYNDIPLGDLHPGMNYIEILLEAHGQITGFTLQIETGKTPNSTILLPNIPLLSQKSQHLFALTSDTIETWGCNLTSHAMILDYYAHTYKPDFVTDPITLNDDWVNYFNVKSTKTLSGYDDGEGNLSWDNIPNYSENKGIHLDKANIGTDSTQTQKLDASLFSGNPVILLVHTYRKSSGKYDGNHFVVAIGKKLVNQTATYIVYDPNFGQGTLLDMGNSNYYYGFQSFYSYQPKLNKPLKNQSAYIPYLLILAHSPVHLLITDPQGRKLGFDPRIQQASNEIPGGSYSINSVTGFNDNSQPDQKLIYISSPSEGNYIINSIGYADGPYELDIIKGNGGGSPIQTIVTGTAQSSSVDSITIAYSSLNFLFLPLLSKH